MNPVRRETWRQADPFAQLTVLLMSLDGNLSNYQCSIIDRKNLSEQLVELAPFIEKGSW